MKADLDDALRAQIYGWAYRLLQNHHDALDATQEVMLREIQRPAVGVENRLAWLRRVTVNLCVDTLRRKRPPPAPTRERAVGTAAEAEAMRQELRGAVLRGLARLSAQQRAVLVAKVYDRETFAVIAETMGVSVSTVKTHYVRALEALREPLRGFGEP